MKVNRLGLQSLPCGDEETERCHGYQRNLLNLSTRSKNRTDVRVSSTLQHRLASGGDAANETRHRSGAQGLPRSRRSLYETRCRRKQGNVLPVEIHLSKFWSGTVTDQERESAGRHMRRRLLALIALIAHFFFANHPVRLPLWETAVRCVRREIRRQIRWQTGLTLKETSV